MSQCRVSPKHLYKRLHALAPPRAAMTDLHALAPQKAAVQEHLLLWLTLATSCVWQQ